MQSFPWNSIATELGEDGLPVYDRAYSADDLREVYETFFTNGVFLSKDGGAFKVSPDSGMTVLVSPGKCCVNGTVGWEDEERKLVLQASGDLDRIDTVVLRWNTNTEARSIDLYVKTGTQAAAPKRPALTRNDSVYELGLADIFVAKETASVVTQRITDTRMESARCGTVAPFMEIDTTTFHDQLQAQTEEAVELANRALDESVLGSLVRKSGDTMTGTLRVSNEGGAANNPSTVKQNVFAVESSVENEDGSSSIVSTEVVSSNGGGGLYVYENIRDDDGNQWPPAINYLQMDSESTSLKIPLGIESGGTGATSIKDIFRALGIKLTFAQITSIAYGQTKSVTVNYDTPYTNAQSSSNPVAIAQLLNTVPVVYSVQASKTGFTISARNILNDGNVYNALFNVISLPSSMGS